MNFMKFRVLEDLFVLSKKSDEIIKKSFAETVIDDSFFEETKNKIRQILDGEYSPRECYSRVQKENDDLIFEYKPSFRPLTVYRCHVHEKNENQNCKIQTEDSSNKISLSPEDVKSDESVGHQVTLDRPPVLDGNNAAQARPVVSKRDSTIVLSSDSVVEIDPPYVSNPEDCVNSNDIFENINGLETNLSNSKITSSQISLNSENIESVQQTPDMKIRSNNGIGKTIILKRNKIKKSSFINDKRLSNCNGTLQNKTTTLLNKKKGITTPNSPDVRSTSKKLVNKGISHTRYAISSDTNKENMDCSISKRNSMIYVTNSPFRTVNRNEQRNITRCLKSGKRKKCHEILTETSALSTKKNITKTTEDVLFHTNKHKKSRKCNIFSSPNVSPEVKVDVSKPKPEMIYRLRSLENKCSNVKQSSNGSEDIEAEFSSCKSPYLPSNYTNPTSEFNRIKSVLKLNTFPNLTPKSKNEKRSIPIRCPGKRKLCHMNKSSTESTWELDNRKYGIKDSKQLYARKELVSTKNCRTILNGKNTAKKSPSQFQTKSAPAHHKKTVSRKPRSSVESAADCNRQSLKVKADEKRKQREIRVQRTKERRERLEKEREERIRLSEQRLKQRFQQHEETLKQKTEKFKIKPRNRQPLNTERNLSSTSSKDSSKEDTARDNDDCCRNSEDSGQKLSKESNGYHDVSLKEVYPTSLEGNAGINPGISKEHNAILVGREKAPVELAVSCNGNELKSVSVSQDARGMKEFEGSSSESPEQHGALRQDNTTGSCSKSEDASYSPKHCQPDNPDRNLLKQNFTSPTEINSKATKAKKFGPIELFSNKLFCTYSPEKNRSNSNSYFLRSAEKVKKKSNKATKSNAHAIETSENEPGCKYNDNQLSREMMTPSPASEKGKWSNLCLKYKPHKPKVNLKIPSRKDSRQNDSKSMHARSSKYSANVSNIEITKKNLQYTPGTGTKKKTLTSYKISDFHNESFHESRVDPEKIPSWATGVYLKQALVCQHYKPCNVKKLFGRSIDPVDLVDMFRIDKPEYHKRTSSEHWSITPT